jgi:hypothetical protein
MQIQYGDGQYDEEFDLIPRFLLGVTTEFPLFKSFTFEPGILFSRKGYKIDIEDYAMFQTGEYLDMYENSVLNYIDIPLSIKYTADIKKVKLHGVLGPYIGIGLSGKVSYKEYENDGQGGVDYMGIIEYPGKMNSDGLWKRFDYGLQAGIGVEVDKIVARVNYSYGFANIARSTDAINKNKVLGISLGYILNLKK